MPTPTLRAEIAAIKARWERAAPYQSKEIMIANTDPINGRGIAISEYGESQIILQALAAFDHEVKSIELRSQAVASFEQHYGPLDDDKPAPELPPELRAWLQRTGESLARALAREEEP